MRLLLPLAAVCLVQLANAAARNYGNLCEPITSKYNPKGIMEALQASKKKKEEQLQKEYEAYINRYDPEKYIISIQGDGIFVVPRTTKTTKRPTTKPTTKKMPNPDIEPTPPTPPQETTLNVKMDGPLTPPIVETSTPPKVETTQALETTSETTTEKSTEAPKTTTTEDFTTPETPRETTEKPKLNDIGPQPEETAKPIQLVTVGFHTLFPKPKVTVPAGPATGGFDDKCGSVVKFPTEDKCFQFYAKYTKAELKKVCWPGATARTYDYAANFYVGAECKCGGDFPQDSGSGFFCYARCHPRDPLNMNCVGEETCQTLEDETSKCSCLPGFNATHTSQCRESENVCETCKHNCHIGQKCIPSGNSIYTHSCSECDESLGFKTDSKGSTTCNQIDECKDTINGQVMHNCDPLATCNDTNPANPDTFGIRYRCFCKPGYTGEGTKCRPCQDINECFETPDICGTNSDCSNTIGSYACKCRDGYESEIIGGNKTNKNCINIDECKKPGVCLPHSTCNDTEGSFECPCDKGWVGDGKKSPGCEPDPAICKLCDKQTTNCRINSAGTEYECQCKTNHTFYDKHTCKPRTYCDKPAAVTCAPHPKGQCQDNPDGSGYTCRCSEGYTGDGNSCVEIDICRREAPCLNVANTECVSDNDDPYNKYDCKCKPEHIRQKADVYNISKPCYEVGAYVANNCSYCDANKEVCFNETGLGVVEGTLVSCQCRNGYNRQMDATCYNHNECLKPEDNDCDVSRAECIDEIPTKNNSFAKFSCKCLPGYVGDGKVNNCKDINECEVDKKLCTAPGEYCFNLTPFYECRCHAGFIKDKTTGRCIDINECITYHKCNAFSDCINTPGSYNCSCKEGFRQNGTLNGFPTCVSIDQCAEGWMGTGKPVCDAATQDCYASLGSFTCECKKGFKRENNECKDINECRTRQYHDCDESTTNCRNTPGSFECDCKDGFKPKTNKTCEDINECATGTAQCHPNSHCVNVIGSYECACNEGFQQVRNSLQNKPYCERTKVCEKNPFICNGGICIDTDTEPFFQCQCREGTAAFNNTMCIDSKYCDDTDAWTCPKNSKCQGSKVCQCDIGYTWKDIAHPITLDKIKARECEEIVWCKAEGKKKCAHTKCKATPENGPGTGTCFCDDGFELVDGKCHDINECVVNKKICPQNAFCDNTPGSYVCHCNVGYTKGPGSNATHPICEDYNECELQMDNCTEYTHTTCKNTVGAFKCECLDGYKRDQIGNDKIAEGQYANRGCVDIDECEGDVCDPIAECINCEGSYNCKCPPGYEGPGTLNDPCRNVDECAKEIHNCTLLQNCHDTNGSFYCTCKTGYEMIGGQCQNINECLQKPCKNNMTCKDTIGSYTCNCPNGYYLHEKSGLCEDIDECSDYTICPQGKGDICVNTPGSYVCDCIKGYDKPCKGNGCKQACKDINECELGKCGKGTNCTNLDGGYKCECKTHYDGDAYSPKGCEYVDICKREECKGAHEVCVTINQNVRRCDCANGYVKELDVCVENPCNKKKCTNGGTCMTRLFDKKVIATCICPEAMIYDEDNDKCVPSNICECGPGVKNCTGSPKCSDPDLMYCFNRGPKPDCQCFDYLKYNEKTKKCDEINPCEPSPCPGKPFNTTCTVVKDKDTGLNRTFTCDCGPGYLWWKDEIVEHAPGSCEPDIPCSKENFCIDKPNTECHPHGHICVCDKNHTLDKVLDKCIRQNPCDLRRKYQKDWKCPENSWEDPRGDKCECNCYEGYEKECTGGVELCVNINECKQHPNPCDGKNATHPECIDTDGGYYCGCGEIRPDYHFFNGSCVPVDVCDFKQIVCEEFSSCEPATGDCKCNDGYKPDPTCTKCPCKPIDFCKEGLYYCMSYATCKNIVTPVPTYDCVCRDGYEKTEGQHGKFNFTCKDINECEKNPCPEGSKCHNLDGHYRCECLPPLIQHDKFRCAKNQTWECSSCVEHAHCIKIINEANAFNCTCDYGYDGDGKVKCEPRKFCELDKPCGPNTECENGQGDFKCHCLPGFTGNGKDKETGCKPINFCEFVHNKCPIESRCTLLTKPEKDYPIEEAKAWTNCTCTAAGFEFHRETFTCEDVNECQRCTAYPHCPCPKDAIECINTQGSFTCKCPAGYQYDATKNSCENIDECKSAASSECRENTGVCVDLPGSWRCECKPGYRNLKSNFSCEKYDMCGRDDNCDKASTNCVDLYDKNTFMCKCKVGFNPYLSQSGALLNNTHCFDIDECAKGVHDCDPVTEMCANTKGSYTCDCANGYDRDEKTKDCVPLQRCEKECPSNSKCLIARNGTSDCFCNKYYTHIKDLNVCTIDECDKTQCGPNQRCIVQQNRNNTEVKNPYLCICLDGYVFSHELGYCTPKDRARRDTNACDTAECGIGSCERTEVAPFFRCHCPSGGCKKTTCSSKRCDVNAKCVDPSTSGGSAYCQCKDGWTGFGTVESQCYEINGCLEMTCSEFAGCSLENGVSVCTCDPHYKGNGTWCINVNECIEKGPKGEILHNCDENANCTDTQGGFHCTCKKGFSGVGTHGDCHDIDECLPGSNVEMLCDKVSTTCNNTIGSYECLCNPGFKKTSSPTKCEDIDECALDVNNTLCGIHTCHNTLGSYECICKSGYAPSANKKECKDIDECAESRHDCHQLAKCTNTEGSFVCNCTTGYEGDGKAKCSLIDQCAENATPKNRCDKESTTCKMFSDEPKYKCHCLPGFAPPAGQSEYFNCDDIDECSDGSVEYDRESTICTNTKGSYELKCKPGYENVHPQKNESEHNVKCENLNECEMDEGFLETRARMDSGMYNISDWKTIMVAPKNNDSGYAHCYYAAMRGVKFNGASLPMCMDSTPDKQMYPFKTFGQKFDFPYGFTCACPAGDLPVKTSGGISEPQCSASKCECNAGMVCREGTCICANPVLKMRKEADRIICSEFECQDGETLPDNLLKVASLLSCVGNKYVAKQGYQLVRDNMTTMVVDVIDINECEAPQDPCCRGNCSGPDCVKCLNTDGSFECIFPDSTKVCERDSVDKNTCKCGNIKCPETQSWYYNCVTKCNTTMDPRLDQPEYKKKVCTKFMGPNDGYVTLSSLRELYQKLCDINTSENNNKYGCFFDKESTDLTKTALFNYWGECTDQIKDVKCVEGTPFIANGLPVCPTRTTLPPETPAVAQPLGQKYPSTLYCRASEIKAAFEKGNFGVNTENLAIYEFY